jgi:hypothetical protein
MWRIDYRPRRQAVLLRGGGWPHIQHAPQARSSWACPRGDFKDADAGEPDCYIGKC